MGYVGGEIEAVGGAHLGRDCCKFGLIDACQSQLYHICKQYGQVQSCVALGERILTRCSGGMEVQHMMTPRRGNWGSAMLVAVRRS